MGIIRPRQTASPLHDYATGLPNRALVWEMLEHGISRAARDRMTLAVMLIYIEGIGDINETHGRAAGDRVIAAVTDRLISLLRETDTIGRFGGTKLAILLETMSETADIQIVAEKIINKVNRPVVDGDIEAQLCCSVGIALFPTTASSAETLIRRATVAMDAVKEQGGNGFLFG